VPSFVSFEPKELIEKILVLEPEKRPTAKEILSNPWLKRLRTMNFFADSSISSNADTELNHSESIFNQLVLSI
jgi:serine/threonine protein kinase